MATINATTKDHPGGNFSYAWTLANGDAGSIADHTGTGDRTVQVQGTFGAGGSVSLEGSIDRLTWYTLRDTQAVSLTFTAAGLKTVLESVPYIRPRVTAGDGTTAIQVFLNVRR